MQIEIDDRIEDEEVRTLLGRHLELMYASSPACSVHALDLDALRAPEVTFWTVRDGGALLGCGAMKEVDPGHGEVKSMHTAERARRGGVGAHMLAHIIDEARRRGYRRLSLETGSQPAFAPARAFYEGFGFSFCEPFGDYAPDPASVFMTRTLD